MSQYNYAKPIIRPYIAGEALEANRLVIISTAADTVEYPAAARDTQLVGITTEAAASGAPVNVAVGGFALLKVDGNAANIAWGDSLMAHDSAGYGGKCTTGGAGSVECIGFADGPLTSTADGDLITCRIDKHSVYFAA